MHGLLKAMAGFIANAFLVVFQPTPANAAVVALTCPSAPVENGDSFAVEIAIDVGARALGAYSLVITYDETIAIVTSIAGGQTPEFTGLPFANPDDFATGRTRLLAFNSSSLTTPTGIVSVARVTFSVSTARVLSIPIALEVITLADTDGVPVAADTMGCLVPIVGATPAMSPTKIPPTSTHAQTKTATAMVPVTPTAPQAITATVASTPSMCVGDCLGDGSVTVSEVITMVNIALETANVESCVAGDLSGDERITVDEIVLAARNALGGCPRTFLPTATAPPTRTASPTTGVNHPPSVPCSDIYRTYPGYPMRMSINALDPDSDRLQYVASNLPAGARLDEAEGVFTWTPTLDQLGPFYLSYAVTDDGTPRQSAQGELAVKVLPLDACTMPTCDPEVGCSTALLPLDQSCCKDGPTVRVAEPSATCPEGRVTFVGRNNYTFGRLQNCDRLSVINFLQAGASVRFRVQARCLNASQQVTVHARLETAHRVLFDRSQVVRLRESDDGYAESVIIFPVTGPGPFYEFEGADAMLAISVTDIDGVVISESLRLLLTFQALDDLPEVNDGSDLGSAQPCSG